MGSPVTGSFSVTLEPAGYTCVLPATLKPVTWAVVPVGMLAVASTLPLTGWSMGVVAVSGLSEYTADAGVPAAAWNKPSIPISREPCHPMLATHSLAGATALASSNTHACTPAEHPALPWKQLLAPLKWPWHVMHACASWSSLLTWQHRDRKGAGADLAVAAGHGV